MLQAWQQEIRYQSPRLPSGATCAVVGSSGVLINSSLGSSIDSHDLVFRMNTAPVHGHELDVGIKTSIRIATINAAWHLRRKPEDAASQLVYYCHTHWIGACWHSIPPSWRWRAHVGDPAPRLSPSLLRVAHAVLRTSHLFPTSGMMALLAAFGMCHSVTAFGFGVLPTTRCSKYYGACVDPQLYDLKLTNDQSMHASIPKIPAT